MTTRRTFFRKAASIALALAMAPEIAFHDPVRLRLREEALELLPWQDNFTNVITQMLLVAKQNLANMNLQESNDPRPSPNPQRNPDKDRKNYE